MIQLTVGQRIRRLRDERSIRDDQRRTQKWLADQVGVSKSAVVKWERDVQKPAAEHALKLADVFGVTPETFVSEVASNGGNGETAARAQESLPPYNEAREEAELTRISELSDPLLRTMERESVAAVVRAQAMRDACRAARIEAEKALDRSAFSSAELIHGLVDDAEKVIDDASAPPAPDSQAESGRTGDYPTL